VVGCSRQGRGVPAPEPTASPLSVFTRRPWSSGATTRSRGPSGRSVRSLDYRATLALPTHVSGAMVATAHARAEQTALAEINDARRSHSRAGRPGAGTCGAGSPVGAAARPGREPVRCQQSRPRGRRSRQAARHRRCLVADGRRSDSSSDGIDARRTRVLASSPRDRMAKRDTATAAKARRHLRALAQVGAGLAVIALGAVTGSVVVAGVAVLV